MTLYELLNKVSFDEIAPFLSKSYAEGRSLAWFKMHYDYLRHLVPLPKSEKDYKITVDIVPQTGSDTDESRITVSAWLDGNPWEDSLGREIIIEDFDNSRIAKTEAIIGKKVVVPNSADISLAEIAACCIWETSFYAFLPHDWESLGMRLHLSCYDEAKVFRHCIEKYGKFIPSRNEMMNIRSFHNKIRREMKFYHRRRYSKFDGKFLGGEKRKRRMWKRWEINEEYKKRIVNTAEFIDDLHERGINLSEPPTTEQLSVLFRSKACWIGCWHTCAFDASRRCDYLKELIEKYDLAKGLNQNNSIISISTSPKHPLQSRELETLHHLLSISVNKPQFCMKADDALEDDLRIDFAFYSM